MSAIEVEEQNQAIISKMEEELKIVKKSNLAKNRAFDDFRKYRNINTKDDYHYRIMSDPNYQPSSSDMLLSDGEDHFKCKPKGKMVSKNVIKTGHQEAPRLDSDKFLVDLANEECNEAPHQGSPEKDGYDDYPQLYFPTSSDKPVIT